MKTNLRLAFASLMILGVAVACGKGGSNGNASIKEIKQEDQIAKGLKTSFPGYDPAEPQNIEMAARLLGATIEVVERTEKKDKVEAAAKVRVTMLLDKPVLELKSEGIVDEGLARSLDIVKSENDKDATANYKISARCISTSGCNQVLAILEVEEEISGGTTTADSQVVVTNEKPEAEAKPDAKPETKTEVKTMKPKQVSAVAVLFALQKDGANAGQYVVAWSASNTIGNYLKGGTRKSVAEAKGEKAVVEGGVKAQPAEGGSEDPLPKVKEGDAAAAPEKPKADAATAEAGADGVKAPAEAGADAPSTAAK